MKTTYSRWGRKIKDSSEPLTVRVRPIDIKHAVCRDHERCVIANAIKRSKKAPWVNVGADTVIVGDSAKTGTRFKLDSLGKEVVRYFDTSEGGAGPTPPETLTSSIPRKRGCFAPVGYSSRKRNTACS